jgi:opacity protein-like surface antigen
MEFEGSDFEVNLVPPGSDPQASNRTFRSTSAAFEMPSYFTLAATYDLWKQDQQRLAALGSFQNNNFALDHLAGGLEWTYRESYALRASWFGSFGSTGAADDEDSEVEFDSGDDLYSGFALGAGASIRTGDTGRLGFDIAWRPVREWFDDVVEVGLKFGF